MNKIVDFICPVDNSPGIKKEIALKCDLTYPDAYLYASSMEKISKAIKQDTSGEFCILPFCHTLEAEAMGGIINYGDETAGPRAKEYICTDIKEILKLKSIDFSSGRIRETLEAAKNLIDSGEDVVLEITGPFTILNVLIDFKYVVKALRKDRELMKEIYQKLGNEVLSFVEEALKYNIKIFSYADSAGGFNILGPKYSEIVVEDFTYEFMKKLSAIIDKKATVVCCPKTTFALLGTDKAYLADRDIEKNTTYVKGIVENAGKIPFLGQACIKDTRYVLERGIIKELVLK